MLVIVKYSSNKKAIRIATDRKEQKEQIEKREGSGKFK